MDLRTFVVEARIRRRRLKEFQSFCSGAAIVFTGLLLASLYLLLTHQFPA